MLAALGIPCKEFYKQDFLTIKNLHESVKVHNVTNNNKVD